MGIGNLSDCGYGGDRYKTAGGFGGGTTVAQDVATLGDWKHHALVFDNGTVHYFIDGQLQGTASSTSTTTPTIPNDVLYLGGKWDASNGNNQHQVNGSYRAIRISSSARYLTDFTPPEVLLVDADTLNLYSLDEGTGTTIHDSVDASVTGTIFDGWKADETWTSYECPL